MYNRFDHTGCKSLADAETMLEKLGCRNFMAKELPKNANDKNQIYLYHDASILNDIFALTFGERGETESNKKRAGKPIAEAKFDDLSWVDTSGAPTPLRSCKAIVYHQYPEARLSGFQTVDGEMPRSLAVDYTKSDQLKPRVLLLGADLEGKAYGIIIVGPNEEFLEALRDKPFAGGSKVCRLWESSTKRSDDPEEELLSLLRANVGNTTNLGVRLKTDDSLVPFNGTQVGGYTLEALLGIPSNADKDGDFRGIELKTFSQKRLTLFTPEPDGGIYRDSFEKFMREYGYEKEGAYRFTGLHRVGEVASRSQLRMEIIWTHPKTGKVNAYSSYAPIATQLNGLEVRLIDSKAAIAASWSIERLMNNWGVKHQSCVYLPCKVTPNEEQATIDEGYKKIVAFGGKVLWCKKTSMKHLLDSLESGTVFLDPAPKFDPENAKNNKRRSQWRVNDIYKCARDLYVEHELKLIAES